MPDDRPPSWWLDDALRGEPGGGHPAAPLEGQAAVDVAVIGGGYTGLWTALALVEREPSLRVAVLEAELCGWGASGRNGGFLHGYWSTLARARDVLGDRGALELARACDRILPAVRELLARRGADAGLREGGMLRVSMSPAQDAAVERSVAAARALGAPEEAIELGGAELAARLPSPGARRAVMFRDGAGVQPAALARALRAAALDAGIAVHERTRVTRLAAGAPNVLETAAGRLRADAVVVATNAALAGFAPAAPHVTAFGSHVVLTEPCAERLDAMGWTGDEVVVDARVFLHYFRRTPEGRVLMGTASGLPALGSRVGARLAGDAAATGRAEDALRRFFPALAGVRVERAWGGAVDVSADGLPFAGTVAGTSIHYLAGYSGNGAGPSWLGGQILASLALGSRDEWSRSPLAGRRPPAYPPEPLRYMGGRVVRAAAVRVEQAQERGHRPSAAARAIARAPAALGVTVGRG